MTAEIIAHLNPLLQPLVDLPTQVRLVGLVRVVEKRDDGKEKRFPMAVDATDTVPVLPQTGTGLLMYWEGRGKPQVLDQKENRSRFKAPVRLVLWFDTTRIQSGQSPKLALTAYVLQCLLKTPYTCLPAGVPALEVRADFTTEDRKDLFGAYTYDHFASQYMADPYDAVGIDFTLTFWLNHGNDCLPDNLFVGPGRAGC